MKSWLPVLAIVPAGLLIGLAGARLADPGTTLAALAQGERRQALAAPADRVAAGPASAAPADDGGAQPGRSRPDLAWDSEFRPEDHVGFSAGPYAHDEYYFGEPDAPEAGEDPAAGLFADPASSPRGVGRGEATQAARAAERAAQDAARSAGLARAPSAPATVNPPAASPPPANPAEPASREPRAADGDLPAIW